ncbi:MAG: hypothetical protein ACI4F2_09220 [Acutalibacteraceae bacterium]
MESGECRVESGEWRTERCKHRNEEMKNEVASLMKHALRRIVVVAASGSLI